MHEGHRKRMLERVSGRENLRDHELLEILLYNPIPRKNTNETAHRLLTAFGSIRGVLSASEEELVAIEGVGESTARYLNCVGMLLDRISEEEIPVPKAFNFREFYKTLAERFKGLKEEYIDFFSLDASDRIKDIVRFTSHESGMAEITFEEITRFFLAHHPAGLVVAHNHPEGPVTPSGEDDAFTARLYLICSMNGVKLRDHVIYGENEVYSYFMHGRMEDMDRVYNVKYLIGGKTDL